jgi:uncharacterized protein (DUF1810 family)
MQTLDRFLHAQSGGRGATYEQALSELRAGWKTSHLIWYVLPQLRALGRSATAREYGLADRAEAVAYLSHPVLGPRLLECVSAMLAHEHLRSEEILGAVDAMKFRSCLTLFESVAPGPRLFRQALERFYGGQRDALTSELLNQPGAAQ